MLAGGLVAFGQAQAWFMDRMSKTLANQMAASGFDRA
jgi:hypothetical protein